MPQDYTIRFGQRSRTDLRRRWRERDFGVKLHRLTERYGRPPQFDYRDVVERAFLDMPQTERFLPSVLPNWDNTPRCGKRGVVIENATPELFEGYLEKPWPSLRSGRRSGRSSFSKPGTNGPKAITSNPMPCTAIAIST